MYLFFSIYLDSLLSDCFPLGQPTLSGVYMTIPISVPFSGGISGVCLVVASDVLAVVVFLVTFFFLFLLPLLIPIQLLLSFLSCCVGSFLFPSLDRVVILSILL